MTDQEAQITQQLLNDRNLDVVHLKEYVKILETAIEDLLDGGNYNWYEIQRNTGLDEKRCKEIERLFLDIEEKKNQGN